MKVTVIGSGNMGGALIRGLYKASESGKAEIQISATAKTQETLDSIKADCPKVITSLDNEKAVQDADIIILAVKPWTVGTVLDEVRKGLKNNCPILVSIVANTSSTELKSLIKLDIPCVYAMPNIAAEHGESMTFIENTDDRSINEKVLALFSCIGKAKLVSSQLMAPGMMMAGCGIAYVMRYIRASMEAGVEMGFYPADAKQIAIQTMRGAIAVLEQSGLHPEAAIDKVTTPGGITIKGLNELDHSQFNSAVIRSYKAGLSK